MGFKRFAVLVFAGLAVMACGAAQPTVAISPAPSPAATPAQSPEPTPTPPAASPSPSPKASPSPSPEPTPVSPAATVACSGGPATATVVIARSFLYDVADPIHPRLVCRGANTAIHVLDSNAIAYTTVAAGKVVIVRRDMTTGAESRIAQLRVSPQPYYWAAATWRWDGSLEAYSTSNATSSSGTWLVQVHLWSNGADHVLYTVQAGVGGIESRWAQRPILEFGPDYSYLAVSDSAYSITSSSVRVFLVADRRQKFVSTAASSGGTWIANDRLVWATLSGGLMDWTPTGGARVLRSEHWYAPTSSPDGQWVAGTLLADAAAPRAFVASVAGGQTIRTGLASSPRFVTPTVVWYAVEALSAQGGYDATAPNGVIHALDVVSNTDKVVTFGAGEAPMTETGYPLCCRD